MKNITVVMFFLFVLVASCAETGTKNVSSQPTSEVLRASQEKTESIDWTLEEIFKKGVEKNTSGHCIRFLYYPAQDEYKLDYPSEAGLAYIKKLTRKEVREWMKKATGAISDAKSSLKFNSEKGYQWVSLCPERNSNTALLF